MVLGLWGGGETEAQTGQVKPKVAEEKALRYEAHFCQGSVCMTTLAPPK